MLFPLLSISQVIPNSVDLLVLPLDSSEHMAFSRVELLFFVMCHLALTRQMAHKPFPVFSLSIYLPIEGYSLTGTV